MIGYSLVTKQTPPEGVEVNQLMVAHALDIDRETYFAILMDRDSNGPVMVGSPDGGVDIEEVAETNPDSILKIPVDIKASDSSLSPAPSPPIYLVGLVCLDREDTDEVHRPP